MLIGLCIYLYALPLLPVDELHKASKPRRRARGKAAGCERAPRASWCCSFCSCPTRCSGRAYEQMGNTIILWADANTDRSIDALHLFGVSAQIPTTWFLAVNPFMIFAFTPFVVALWARQAARGTEPATITKMALGCFGVGAYLIMAAGMPAAGAAEQCGQSELAVAVRLFRRHHDRRALSLAGRAVVRDQSRAGALDLALDGRLAVDEFHRRLSCRLHRQVLEPDGQAGIFSARRRRRGGGGGDDLRL